MKTVKTRFQRGLQIHAEGSVGRSPDPNLYFVTSQTNPDTGYRVRWDPEEGQHECSCPDWAKHGFGHWCKHLHAVDCFRMSVPLSTTKPKPKLPVKPENAGLVEARKLIEELYGPTDQ